MEVCLNGNRSEFSGLWTLRHFIWDSLYYHPPLFSVSLIILKLVSINIYFWGWWCISQSSLGEATDGVGGLYVWEGGEKNVNLHKNGFNPVYIWGWGSEGGNDWYGVIFEVNRIMSGAVSPIKYSSLAGRPGSILIFKRAPAAINGGTLEKCRLSKPFYNGSGIIFVLPPPIFPF